MIGGKKIAIDARMIEHSGIGTYIQNLLKSGVYDVAVGDKAIIRKYNKQIEVIEFKAKLYLAKEQFLFPVKKLIKQNVKLIHFPHYNVPYFCPIPFVVTVHDLIHFVYPEFLGGYMKRFYSKLLMKNALKESKYIITVSNYSKKDIEKYFRINSDKIKVIYNVIDKEFRVKDQKEYQYLYNKYNISYDKKVLLCVGNMKPNKNIKEVLEALALMPNRNKTILLLVGKAFESENNLKELEKELKITDSVIHTGFVKKEELVDLYNLADVFVFPSLYEGFGLPPLEAMSCGTPVICSNTSALPEVVGEAATLISPGDPMNLMKKIEIVLFGDYE